MTPSARILVVEDSPTQAEEVRLSLEAEGFEVRTAPNSQEALELLDVPGFDLVISDVVMPGLSGYDLCRMLKSRANGRDVPVILLTALTDPMDIIQGLECGADNFLTKPCRPDLLVSRVNTILDNRRIRAEGKIKVGVEISFLGKRFTINADREQILDLLVSTFEDIVRTNREILSNQKKLNALLHIAEGLNQTRCEKEVTQTALERAMDLPGVVGGWIVLLEGADFRVAATRSLPPALHLAGAFEGGCLCLRTLRTGGLTRATNVVECERLSRPCDAREAAWIHASVPLRSGDRVLGVMNLLGPGEGHFSAEDLRLLDGLGDQIAIALERARMQEQLRGDLRASEERYHSLMEHANDAIFILDSNGAVLEVNRQAEAMLGRPAGEITGRRYADFMTTAEVEGPAEPIRTLLDAVSARVHDVRMARADGRRLIADISSSRLQVGGERMVLVIARDVTERNELERQFHQSQKFEAIGQLAGGVAHDFNNLLTVITGHADLMRGRLPEEDSLVRDLDEIGNASGRAAALTRQLLAFSRKQILAPRVVDLNAVVTDIKRMLGRLIGEDIDLNTITDPSLGRVRADPAQIDQVIMNLAVNARDAMPKGGKLVIETANVQLDGEYARRHIAVKPGPYVMLAVSDTGCGMDQETQAHLFEPFFTTKEQGKGTGLGLSTVYGIVKQSGGNLWVYSEPGRGTTFKIYLPRIEDAVEAAEPARQGTKPPRGWETILLVEDEDVVRSLAARILERSGYKVLQARHGGEALQVCERQEGPIHLVVADVVMPEMSGRELVERLASLLPDMRVLLMSGYTGNGLIRQGRLDSGVPYLQKPFTADSLARQVRTVLDTDRKA